MDGASEYLLYNINMKLESLKLHYFRNYLDETIKFDPRVNIMTGKNGEGKTNLVEAVYLLSMGRSFRTNKDMRMICFDKDAFAVTGGFEKDGDRLDIEVRMAGRQKEIFINGVPHRKSADLQGLIYTVLFSPDDLRITNGEPENRRRFMDRELFQIKPLYYLDVHRYRRILKNRNLLLKEEIIDTELLDTYDNFLAESAARIVSARLYFSGLLDGISGELALRITDGKEKLSVGYVSGFDLEDETLSCFDGTCSADEQKEVLLEIIRSGHSHDIESGTTTAGPHKDDLRLISSGVDLREYGSRGQQRTAALALKLAELEIIENECGQKAILLLDDVLSELDKDRQKFLIGAFEGHQILLTAAELTQEMLNEFPKGKTFEIINGSASEKSR